MRGAGLLAMTLAACADPAVSLELQPPADQAMYDTSCVSTFEIFTDGGNYPADANDFNSIEVKVDQPHATYAELIASLRGKFDIPIPSTGLAGVEVYAWNGDSGFATGTTLNPELAFLAVSKYDGGDTFTVPLVPNQSCARGAVTLRPLDLVPFLMSAPRACSAGALATGSFALGTLTPALYRDATFFWGGVASGDVGAAGTVSMQGATQVGPESCLAATGGTDAGDTSTSCLAGAGVCGHPGEYEIAVFDNVWYNNSLDKTIAAKFKGMTVGAVFDTARASLAGATVEIDPAQGQLVFVDLDPTTKTFRPADGATATTASGLFLLYANTLVDVKITAKGHTTTVRMGTPSGDGMAATIVM